MRPFSIFAAALLLFLSGPVAAAPAPSTPAPAIAMHGKPKYGPDFKHFDYADPSAAKGGEVKLAAIGTYDSLNPFIIKGVPAAAIALIFDTLMSKSADEAFSEYGSVAESVETPEDRSWATYSLRPQARFHDGSPITADDVIFSFDVLKAKGLPMYRAYYAGVATVEKLGERKVKFVFKPGDNRELPLILGELPILSKAYYANRDFDKTTLEAPMASGPYKVEAIDPGRSITLRRVENWWGESLPLNVGRYNFDRIRTDYYRDGSVALEALKAGEYDFRQENVAKNWATAYDVPPVRDGLIKKETIKNENPTGMQGFAYNTRRPLFKDPLVREALGYAFDFEWTNKNLFFGAYTRTESYFSNSELASRGLPSAEETKTLAPFRDKLPAREFTQEFHAPASDGSGNIRPNLKTALDLLAKAGWTINKDGKLADKDNNPFTFEILIDEPTWERITLPFARNLERLGITAQVRNVDSAQYENRLRNFDFDMIVMVWSESLSPGNEQREFWGSGAAAEPGSRNYAGIRDATIDKLIDQVISAPDRDSLVTRTRALDRSLLWGFYVIPHWHLQAYRIAYWDKFGRPAVNPKYELGFLDTWWVDAAKAAKLQQRRAKID